LIIAKLPLVRGSGKEAAGQRGGGKDPDNRLRTQYAAIVREEIERTVADPGDVAPRFMNFAKL
jgi:hypothetical protein